MLHFTSMLKVKVDFINSKHKKAFFVTLLF